ncbi:MAG TPA: phosphoribosylformylglycinamidine synthase subunit PurL [Terriglobia bacterium]|nr:phosphoribosylformylglycinamidine synthase subunit PurL [Terriglobia bacterium]
MITETEITPEIVKQHGLTNEEYGRIVKILGRHPTLAELGIFSVMWSEHCSYKSSKPHLRRLPTGGARVIQGPGENAGIIDIGNGYAIAFKIESHNHPSFVEPFQGAATGVGGILRDIFTMGARPIAAMNSLRFGPLDKVQNRHIMEGVVAGIASYGNCFGVPTVGGEVVFDECYSLNPLVNAFALGIFKKDHIFYGKACGVGNPVIYVGSKTGRDGIHGATMASAEFDEESESKRPNVQVGDPFMEKLLLEACLEAMKTGSIVGIQDMGAAGLTCSTCEMGGRAGTGIEIDLQFVPQRETGMSPYEIMLSESQERMLLVAEKGREDEVIRIFKKWEIDAVVIGQVTADGLLRVKDHGTVVAEIPNLALTEEAPVYHRPIRKPAATSFPTAHPGLGASSLQSADWEDVLMKFLASPNLGSREWVFRQYDHMVRTNTVQVPSADAAVLRVKKTDKALAMTLDGNGRYCRQNPRRGAAISVAESCRNLVCAGAEPLAATNCLNFGNPEKPEIMWQFSEVIDGMAEACRVFQTPITGGNVSFYNETLGEGVSPTPVIGMVGLIQPVSRVQGSWFVHENDLIALLGDPVEIDEEYKEAVSNAFHWCLARPELSDLYTSWVSRLPCPPIELSKEAQVQKTCLEANHAGLLISAHDCSDGGLVVALAEMTFSHLRKPVIGATIELPQGYRLENLLFAEYQSRILVTFREKDLQKLQELAARNSVTLLPLGTVGGNRFRVNSGPRVLIEKEVAEMEKVWKNSMTRFLVDIT